jgi:hypothetical protein
MSLEQNISAAHRVLHDESANLVSRLGDAHELLAEAIAALERLTLKPLDPTALASARWRLSAANRARRAVWQDCYHFLLPLVDRPTAAALTELKVRDMEMARASAAHLARWPARAAQAEWPTYCQASRAIRGPMTAAMQVEMRLLAPLLQKHRVDRRRVG